MILDGFESDGGGKIVISSRDSNIYICVIRRANIIYNGININ